MGKYIINTPCGDVKGTSGKDGCIVYKGIRYARAGRWEYPEQVTKWDGVYDATNYQACSYQPRSFYDEAKAQEKAFYYREFREGEQYCYSEDCLFLNIWKPETAQNLPVLFYIHGGGFIGGCGHEKHFDGFAYCKQNVIVVTINYRLGPLGFCCLPSLEQEAGHTGNYALFDQMCALQWVRDNIGAFGGNAENITIMGQSAGAMSVQQMSISPLTKGMFAHAIMQSGGGVSALFGNTKKAEDTYPFWQALREKVGAKDLAEFRAVSPQMLIEGFCAIRKERKDSMRDCGPVIDNVYITETAQSAAKEGHQHDVPYLMGSTSEDMVHKMAKSWARLQYEQKKQESYTYFFCRQLPGDNCGAWHSSDLWYAFGTLANGWRPFEKWDYELSDFMVRYFSNFAKTGNPNGDNLPQWLPNVKGQSNVMRFDNRDVRMGGVNMVKLTHTMLTKPNIGE